MFNICRQYKISIDVPNYIKKKLNIPTIQIGTSEDFRQYEEMLKSNHPYMFWFENVFCDKLQRVVCYPYEIYSNIRAYISNRFITKPHYLDTKLKRGVWYDYDTRLLHGAFEAFVDYVEKEVGAMGRWSKDDVVRDHAGAEKWTDRDWALYYFDWEINETHEAQAEAAKTKKMLYLWWKDVYLTRPDLYATVDDSSKTREYYSSIHTEEARRNDEDTAMLIELVKVRQGCWT